MKKVFVIDNYDSFTYNLVHYLEELGCDVTVKRNDCFELKELEQYEYIFIASFKRPASSGIPGPG